MFNGKLETHEKIEPTLCSAKITSSIFILIIESSCFVEILKMFSTRNAYSAGNKHGVFGISISKLVTAGLAVIIAVEYSKKEIRSWT